MADTYLPVLDYGMDTAAADSLAPEPCTANVSTTQQQRSTPPAAPASAEHQTAGASDSSRSRPAPQRTQPAASTSGRGHVPGQWQPGSSQQQEQPEDELQQYTRRRRKAVLLNMLRLLEQGAKDAEDLQRLMQLMSGDELMQVAEERALAKLCGNPLCANFFEWDGPRWSISGEAIERPEGECFCSKACSSYISELAKQLGGPMQDLTAEALAAEAHDGVQQQMQQQPPQLQQRSQRQQHQVQKPKVAAGGKNGPTMLANIQERVPASMQLITEQAHDSPDLDPTQLMAEVAAADRRYRQAGVVEGYMPRMQPRSLAAVAAARAGPLLGSEAAVSLQPQSMSLASSSAAQRCPDASTSRGNQQSAVTTARSQCSDSPVLDDDTSQVGRSDDSSSSSSSSSSQVHSGRRAEAQARIRTPEVASHRSILKKSSPHQQRPASQPAADATSSSQPSSEGRPRGRSVRFAREVQYQEQPDASQPVSDTAPSRDDTAQPLLGDVIERCTSAQGASPSLMDLTKWHEAAASSASGAQSGDAAEASESQQPVLCFTLDDPSSVLEAGNGAEGQLGAQYGQLQVLGAGAEDEGGEEGAAADRDEASAAAMPRALQLWFPPAAGGVGVPVQRAAPLQQPKQTSPAAQMAAAVASHHRQGTGSSGAASAASVAAASGLPHQVQGQPSERQPPPQQPRRFRPVCPPRRKVVMLDSPADAALQRQRGPPQAAARNTATPASSAHQVAVSEAMPAQADTSAAAAPSTPDMATPAAAASPVSDFTGSDIAPAAATSSAVVSAPVNAARQAVATSDRSAAAASCGEEDSPASEDDDASESSSQEWYYDEQGETVQVSQHRQQQQQRGTASNTQLDRDWSDSDVDEHSAGELSGEGSDAEPAEAQQLSSGDSDSEEGDLRATAPFFGAPPKAYHAVLSPFGTLWTIVHAWVGQGTRAYVAGEPGNSAVTAAQAADSATAGMEEKLAQQGGGKLAGAGSRGPLTPPAPLVQTRVALAQAVCGAVPEVMAELRVVGVTESEVTKQLVALVRMFRITGPLPALPQQQWRLIALLFMRALSSVHVPALMAALKGRAAAPRVDGLLARSGFDAAQFAALLDLFVDE